jgi:signal transduction histidine kinase
VLDRQTINLNQLIEQEIFVLEKVIEKQGIQIHQDLMEDLPSIPIVRLQIQLVIKNLLLNAVEAMQDGGFLYITTGLCEDSYIYMSIEDTGPGVMEAIRERMFEPFVSTKPRGAGLGLSESYGIITAHGGILEYDSNKKRGAHFRMILPIKDEQ